MARLIIMPDAKHLTHGIRASVYYAEAIEPDNLSSAYYLRQLMDRISETIIEQSHAEARVDGRRRLLR